MIRKTICALLLFVPACLAQAGEFGVAINGISRHLNTDKKYNEDNTGIGITHENDARLITVGTYRNSDDKESVYAFYGKKKHYARGPFLFEPGFLVGGITGYTEGVAPVILPLLSVGHRRVRINITYTPKIRSDMDAAVALQLEFRQ